MRITIEITIEIAMDNNIEAAFGIAPEITIETMRRGTARRQSYGTRNADRREANFISLP